MKANVFLTYPDDSEDNFEFYCDDYEKVALATLLMVCRGALMASMAVRCVAYNEDGCEICCYYK